MDRYSLICTAYDEGGEGWDTEMGTYPTHEAARAAIPAMMAEWDGPTVA